MRTVITAFFACWSYLLVGQIGPCDQIHAGFLAEVNGTGVQFSNTSVGTGNMVFYWTFGDGSNSFDPQPTHTFDQPGTYQVCVSVVSVVQDPNGAPFTCEDSFCQVVQVGGTPLCSPNFQVVMNWDAIGGGLVVFVATSTNPNTNFIWDFGDGQQAEGPFVDHAYAQAGSYAACVSGWYYNELVGDTCWIEDCQMVVVLGPDPCLELEACFVTNDFGNGTYFFDNCSSQQGNAQFLWNFGDGTTSNIVNVEHVYQTNGTYEVCLTGTYAGCSYETCQVVVVTEAEGSPCDALNAQFTPVVGGFGVNIQNAVVDQDWVYRWSFGDGSTGYGPNTGHQYASAGVYDICLVVYTWDPVTQDTCFADHCVTVTIEPLTCDPDFAVDLAWNASGGSTVSFNATSNHPNTNFIWYFGDGTQGQGPQVSHTYPENGSYYPCVTGWYYNELTQDTCYIEDCATILVGGGGGCEDLVACFDPLPLPNNIIYFENCSTAPQGATYAWDFGDGETYTGPVVEHIYAPGVYTACLVVAWENCVDSTCATFTVGGPCAGFEACFEAMPFENGVYLFENCSQTLPIAIPVTYAWDFGDGTSSSNPQPDHMFEPGTYTVCLTITQGQCVDTYCFTITVSGGASCDDHEAAFNFVSNGLAIQFTSTSTGTGPNTEYLWSFGDGAVAGGANPVHDYAEQGVYEVCLLITTVEEAFPGQPLVVCQDSICSTVDVGFNDPCDELVACYEAVPFENGAFLFENCSQVLSIDIPWQATWDFGDGTTSIEWAPTHSFAPGTYTVCLTVVHGPCTDTYCSSITVGGGGPCDDHEAAFTFASNGLAIQFTSTST
ncbi:MAG: PKD domain-containing protein, partial [Flavobacteriales bacterium]